MNKKVDNISSTDIENAIASAGDVFTAEAVIKALAPADAEALRRRVERFLESDETIFYDKEWNCRTRRSFFNGRKFIITPDDWEISNGILFPGHRFVPFVAENVFPSTVELNLAGKKREMKKFISPLGTCFHYHILLGSEQIFDFLLADDPANESLKHHADKTDPVTLTVYDLADFYKENILEQIEADGTMPLELERTRSYHYSLYGMIPMVMTCELARKYGIDLWGCENSKGGSLRKAAEFMYPYMENPFAWPYEQIVGDHADDSLLFQYAAARLNEPKYAEVNRIRREGYKYIRTQDPMGPLCLLEGEFVE